MHGVHTMPEFEAVKVQLNEPGFKQIIITTIVIIRAQAATYEKLSFRGGGCLIFDLRSNVVLGAGWVCAQGIENHDATGYRGCFQFLFILN